jgi:hypothetical protein
MWNDEVAILAMVFSYDVAQMANLVRKRDYPADARQFG